MAYPSKYTGPEIDAALAKLIPLVIVENGWIKLPSSEINRVDLSTITSPGNYTINFYMDGPSGLTSTPINLMVYLVGDDTIQLLSVLDNVYKRILGSPEGWLTIDVDGLVYSSTIPPSNPTQNKTLWIDISTGVPTMKIWNGTTWVEMVPNTMMLRAIYDPNGLETDFYEYIRSTIANSDISNIKSSVDTHIANEDIHLSEGDRKAIDEAITMDDVNDAVSGLEIKLQDDITTEVNKNIGTITEVGDAVALTQENLNTHISNTTIHPNVEKQEEWDNKADGDHTHNLDGRVTITPDDIDGVIPEGKLPYNVKERAYVIDGDGFGKWVQSTSTSTEDWRSLTYGNDKYVAVASGTDNYIFSYDGINWTQSTLPVSARWYSVCYGNDKFVVIANDSNLAAYSTDGINWTQSELPLSASWYSVCYGNGKYVVVSYYANKSAYSTDGINWTQSTLPISVNWYSVCYGNDKYVVVARDSSVSAYSTDGINWTQSTLPTFTLWSSVCYGNGKYVAVAYTTTSAYSTDGINWTQSTLPVNAAWYSVCYGNDKYVVVANYTTISAYSTDGINWTQSTLPTSEDWYSLCYGNDKYVAITRNSNITTYTNNDPLLTIVGEPYHNGDSIIITTNGIQKLYFIYDDTKLPNPEAFLEVNLGGTLPWASITDKPTTIEGYGITNAPTQADYDQLQEASEAVDALAEVIPSAQSTTKIDEMITSNESISTKIDTYNVAYPVIDKVLVELERVTKLT